jgi:fibronectin type 3 domain-containing protein
LLYPAREAVRQREDRKSGLMPGPRIIKKLLPWMRNIPRTGGTTWTAAGITKGSLSKHTDYYQTNFNWNTEGLSSDTYLIKVKAKDPAGNEAYLVVDTPWTLDLTVSAVTNLTATPGDGSITLDWDPVPDPDLTSYYPYYVYRSETSGGPYTNIASIYSKSTTDYVNSGLVPNTTYYYVVESVDNYGNKARSAEVSATTLADGTPPNIVSINPSNNTKIGGPDATSFSFRVDFTDLSGSEGAWAEIKYSLDGSEWIFIEPVNGPYFDYNYYRHYFYGLVQAEDLSTGTLSVHYMVYDRWGNLAERTATYPVDLTPPAAPENLTATYGTGQITLSWEAPPDTDVTKYRVYRANSLAGPYEFIKDVTGRTNTTYKDSTVQTGLTYYYKVTAYDGIGFVSEDSNIAAAAAISDTTPPEVIRMTPAAETLFGSNAFVTVEAEDNLTLSSIRLEYSLDGSTWIPIGVKATQGTATFSWDSSSLNGDVEIRAIARDSQGNESEPFIQAYKFDNIAPPVPVGVEGTDGLLSATVSWEPVLADDLKQYKVYFGTAADRLEYWTTVNSSTHSATKTDLEPGKTVYFAVSAVDNLGNESALSQVVSAEPIFDTGSPEMVSLSPAPGTRLSGKINLQAVATDDLKVATITFFYSPQGSDDWQTIGEVTPTYNGDKSRDNSKDTD